MQVPEPAHQNPAAQLRQPAVPVAEHVLQLVSQVIPHSVVPLSALGAVGMVESAIFPNPAGHIEQVPAADRKKPAEHLTQSVGPVPVQDSHPGAQVTQIVDPSVTAFAALSAAFPLPEAQGEQTPAAE